MINDPDNRSRQINSTSSKDFLEKPRFKIVKNPKDFLKICVTSNPSLPKIGNSCLDDILIIASPLNYGLQLKNTENNFCFGIHWSVIIDYKELLVTIRC